VYCREYINRWNLGVAALNQLLQRNKGLVAKISISHANRRRTKNGLVGGVTVHDLVQAGMQVM
jgi:hypothetical protein